MRKSLAVALLSLLALTGCASGEVVQPEAVPVVSEIEAPAAMAAEAPIANPDEQIEKQFTEFALMRADVHGVSKKPSEKAIVTALHAFCEEDKSFKITKSSAYNKNMGTIAEDAYCPYLAN